MPLSADNKNRIIPLTVEMNGNILHCLFYTNRLVSLFSEFCFGFISGVTINIRETIQPHLSLGAVVQKRKVPHFNIRVDSCLVTGVKQLIPFTALASIPSNSAAWLHPFGRCRGLDKSTNSLSNPRQRAQIVGCNSLRVRQACLHGVASFTVPLWAGFAWADALQ